MLTQAKGNARITVQTQSPVRTRNGATTGAPSLNFRRKVLRELKKIKIAWPDLNYATAPGVLILLPSTPPIAPSDQGQLGPVSLPIPAARLASDGPSSAACL